MGSLALPHKGEPCARGDLGKTGEGKGESLRTDCVQF